MKRRFVSDDFSALQPRCTPRQRRTESTLFTKYTISEDNSKETACRLVALVPRDQPRGHMDMLHAREERTALEDDDQEARMTRAAEEAQPQKISRPNTRARIRRTSSDIANPQPQPAQPSPWAYNQPLHTKPQRDYATEQTLGFCEKPFLQTKGNNSSVLPDAARSYSNSILKTARQAQTHQLAPRDDLNFLSSVWKATKWRRRSYTDLEASIMASFLNVVNATGDDKFNESIGKIMGDNRYQVDPYQLDPRPVGSHSVTSVSSMSGGPVEGMVGEMTVMEEEEGKDIEPYNGYQFYPSPIPEVGLPFDTKQEFDRAKRLQIQFSEASLPTSYNVGGCGRYQGVDASRGYYPDLNATGY